MSGGARRVAGLADIGGFDDAGSFDLPPSAHQGVPPSPTHTPLRDSAGHVLGGGNSSRKRPASASSAAAAAAEARARVAQAAQMAPVTPAGAAAGIAQPSALRAASSAQGTRAKLGTPQDVATEEWACLRCTLLNSMILDVCNACEMPRPAAPPASHAASAGSVPPNSRARADAPTPLSVVIELDDSDDEPPPPKRFRPQATSATATASAGAASSVSASPTASVHADSATCHDHANNAFTPSAPSPTERSVACVGHRWNV